MPDHAHLLQAMRTRSVVLGVRILTEEPEHPNERPIAVVLTLAYRAPGRPRCIPDSVPTESVIAISVHTSGLQDYLAGGIVL
jgi:hypothetical protein